MNEMEELLKYVQKTNPDMTIERLNDELKKNFYSSVALVMICFLEIK